MTLDIHVPAGTTGHDRLSVDISAADAGWDSSGLRVAVLAAGESVRLETGGTELLVLPLAGGRRIEVGERSYELAGREASSPASPTTCTWPRHGMTVTSELTVGVSPSLRDRRPTMAAVAYSGREPGPSNHARRRRLLAPGQQLRSRQRRGDLPPAGHRGADPRGQLVLLPGPQARGAQRGRARARGDLLLRDRPIAHRRHLGFGLHRTYASDPEPRRSTCASRSTTATSPSCPTATTARAWPPPATTCTTSTSWPALSEDLVWLAPDDPAHHWIRGTWEGQRSTPAFPWPTDPIRSHQRRAPP